ncbi:MAG: DUF2381 family protein [Deltaproteobacteria bacterium]|nr:DUF2381 family protein [Deltaproteobacteria bacterium]
MSGATSQTMVFVVAFLNAVAIAYAQPARTSPGEAAATRSEAEHLVPPQGGAFEVPVHAGKVCILSFAEKLSKQALASSPDYEIKSWGDDGVAVRAITASAATTTLALATASGMVKVNVTLSVVPGQKPAMTLVRFKLASAEEAFEAQVKAEVAKRIGPLEAELAKARHNMDAQIRARADGLLAERLLRRNEPVRLASHERNDDHVIAHVKRGLLVGEDGYLIFEIENRSGAAYRLTTARVFVTEVGRARDVAGPARLVSAAVDRDPAVIGVVPAGATARGIVVVHGVDGVLGKPLVLELSGPQGRGKIRIDRDIVLR